MPKTLTFLTLTQIFFYVLLIFCFFVKKLLKCPVFLDLRCFFIIGLFSGVALLKSASLEASLGGDVYTLDCANTDDLEDAFFFGPGGIDDRFSNERLFCFDEHPVTTHNDVWQPPSMAEGQSMKLLDDSNVYSDDEPCEDHCSDFQLVFSASRDNVHHAEEPSGTLLDVLVEPATLCQKNNMVKAYDRLGHILRERTVNFYDVQESAYNGRPIDVFWNDILTLMHNNEDIVFDGDGYRSHGELHDVLCPEEHVSLAMFKTMRDKPLTLFQMKFELYTKGYRQYSPKLLGIFESALMIGDVHPCDRQTFSAQRSVDSPYLQELWRNIKSLDLESARQYLYGLETCKRPEWRQALLRLWCLQDDGLIEQLQCLKADMLQHVQPCVLGSELGVPFRINRKARLENVLLEHKNEKITVNDLYKMTGLVDTRALFLGATLSLALDGQPLVYDRQGQTVMLLDKDPPSEEPKEGTNLLTMLYDLMLQDPQMLKEEVAYYAKCGGYWPQGFVGGGRRDFYGCVSQYKEYLVILEKADLICCACAKRRSIARLHDLWDISRTDPVLRKSSEYTTRCKYEVTDEDLKVMENLRDFMRGPIYKVFLQYVDARAALQKMDKKTDVYMEFIKEYVGNSVVKKGPLLRAYFKRFGASKRFGQCVQALMLAQGPGRLMYNLKEGAFFWDPLACAPKNKERDVVVEMFSLTSDYPSEQTVMITRVLRQQGFSRAGTQRESLTFGGLSILGLRAGKYSAELMTKMREAVNFMIKNPLIPASDVQQENALDVTSIVMCKKVVQWQKEGYMPKLWAAYLARKKPEKERSVCAKDSKKSCKKYRKIDKEEKSPEDIIFMEMPALYEKLCEQKVFGTCLEKKKA